MFKSFGLFWQNFAVFKGRSRRRDFWLAVLLQLIIFAVLAVLTNFVGFFKYISEIYALVCVVPSLALCVRRQHDIGKSGKRLFLILIPLVGLIILFVNFVSDSHKVTNKYGPSAKYPDENAELPLPEEDSEPAPIDIPPIYAQEPRTDFAARNESPVPPAATEPAAPLGNIYSSAAEPIAEPLPPQTGAQPVAPAAQPVAPVSQPAASAVQPPDSMYSQGRPMYNAPVQAQPAQQPAAPQSQAPAGGNTQPVQPQGYRTRGFPYGH